MGPPSVGAAHPFRGLLKVRISFSCVQDIEQLFDIPNKLISSTLYMVYSQEPHSKVLEALARADSELNLCAYQTFQKKT